MRNEHKKELLTLIKKELDLPNKTTEENVIKAIIKYIDEHEEGAVCSKTVVICS